MADASRTQKLVQLAAEWKASQPLKQEYETELWEKLRLEWNYNSNHIEGNTLSYGETELLLIHGETKGNHEIREYEEMKAHDVAISRLRELAKEKRQFNEAEIREWNQIILKEPFWADAITPDGERTRKRIMPGEYKTSPNSVRTATGEIFKFVAPIDVSSEMQKLVSSLNDCISVDVEHLPELLAKTHHRFLSIHPFDDGNGRVGRLIVNYVLLVRSMVPLIILSTEKKEYLGALHSADVGIMEPLTDFFLNGLIFSTELGLRASRGERIEELTDIEKKISLFVQEEAAKTVEVVAKDGESLHHLFSTFLLPLLISIDEKTASFEKVFLSRKLEVQSNIKVQARNWQEQLKKLFDPQFSLGNVNQVIFRLILTRYSAPSKTPFNIILSIHFNFEELQFGILYGIENLNLFHKWKYSEPPSGANSQELVQILLKTVLQAIQQKAKTD